MSCKNCERLRDAARNVINALCLKGHSLRDAWEELCLLSGSYCEPFLTWPDHQTKQPTPTKQDSCLNCGNAMPCNQPVCVQKRQMEQPQDGPMFPGQQLADGIDKWLAANGVIPKK